MQAQLLRQAVRGAGQPVVRRVATPGIAGLGSMQWHQRNRVQPSSYARWARRPEAPVTCDLPDICVTHTPRPGPPAPPETDRLAAAPYNTCL